MEMAEDKDKVKVDQVIFEKTKVYELRLNHKYNQ